MGELLYMTQWGGTTQSLLGSHCPAASWTCWNTLCLEWNIHHWKWGKSRGPGLAHPAPCPFLMPKNTHPANMYGMYHQVKFLKLTTSISSRLGVQCSVFYWYDHWLIFGQSTDLEDIITHIEAPTKFTQQILSDSLQSLSLLNTETSLMRKAVLKIGWLWILLLSDSHLYHYPNRMVCVYTQSVY